MGKSRLQRKKVCTSFIATKDQDGHWVDQAPGHRSEALQYAYQAHQNMRTESLGEIDVLTRRMREQTWELKADIEAWENKAERFTHRLNLESFRFM